MRLALISGVLLSALLAGVLQLAPGVFLASAVRSAGGEFLLTQLTHHGDVTLFYLPVAREILDGHFPPFELHDPGGREPVFLRPPGPTLIFAALLRVAGDENRAYLAAGFLFTVAMFLAFYWLGRELFGSRSGALFFAAVGVLTPAATQLPRAFFSPQLFADTVAKNFAPIVRTPILQLFLARIEDPLLTLWIFIAVLALLYRFHRGPTVRRGLVLGAAAGLLLYFYLYYWLFAVVLASLLFVAALFNRLRRGRESLRPWLAAAAVLAVLAIPYIANFVAFQGLPSAAEQVVRVGFEEGWGLRLSVWRDYIAYAVLAVLAYFLLRWRDRRAFDFTVAALAAMAVLWNLQFFIGWNLPPDHWPKTFALPLYALAALATAAAVRRAGELSGRSWRGAIAAALIAASLLLVAKKVVNAAYFRAPGHEWIGDYSFPKPLLDSWRWLDRAAPEAIVLSNSFLTSIYLTGYTSANPYLPFGSNTLLPLRDIEERFLRAHKLFGTPAETLRHLLVYRRDPLAACERPCNLHTALNLAKAPTYLYTQTFNRGQTIFDALTKNSDYTVPAWKIEELVGRYGALAPRWEDFSGDYVYVGPWERELSPGLDLSGEPALELVYDRDGVAIYRVR